MLAQITAPNFCAGLILTADRCTEAAPILRRACLGKTRGEIRALCVRRGWSVRVVEAK